MSLLSHLSTRCGQAFAELGLDPSLGEVVVSQRPELAQFQCNGALVAAKRAGRDPRQIAEEVAAKLGGWPEVARAEVAGPGFINIEVSDDHIASAAQRMETDRRLGVEAANPPLRVVVDYAGPNVAKAMHVGHLRATIIGDSLARLFRFLAHQVVRDPHFGDWGLQMGLVIAEIERLYPDLPYFDAGHAGPYPQESPVTLDDLQEIYPLSNARAENDPEWAAKARQVTVDLQRGRPGYVALWRHMKAASEESQRKDFAALGVEFDLWYGESDVEDRIAPLISRLRNDGVAEESRGALVIRVDEEDDKAGYPPLILESSLGSSLYSTTDLATVDMRVHDLKADLILYVVDARQSFHLEQVFRAARRAGIAPPEVGLEHIRFGTMNSPDGKPFKTRTGGVVQLSDLIEMVQQAAWRRLQEAELAQEYPDEERLAIARQVGIAALKFGDLINNRLSDYIFDLERFSTFEGKTGPYLQYAAVRIRSIQRKAAERRVASGNIIAPSVGAERSLMLELLRLPEVVARAAQHRAPNHLADYAYQLTSSWNRFYDTCHILDQPDPQRQASWLAVADLTYRAIATVLDLLGIEIPDRM
jgi:arginyl-tRNA synthetase